MKDALKAGYA